jgi:hypothetical protein
MTVATIAAALITASGGIVAAMILHSSESSPPTPAQSSSPPTGQTTPPTEPTSPTDVTKFSGQEAELLAALNGNDFQKCTAQPDAEDSDTIAVLHCGTVRSGPEREPFIGRAADATALSRLVAKESDNVSPSGRCSLGQDSINTWKDGTEKIRGPIVCQTKAGYFRIWWADNTTMIYMIAEAKDGAALYTWWQKGNFLR